MLPLRAAAPFNQQVDSSASSPSKITSDSASGASEDASKRNRKDSVGASASGGDGDKARRRRTAGSVSLMACSLCRQARQRVGMNVPRASSFPISYWCSCVYRDVSLMEADRRSVHSLLV